MFRVLAERFKQKNRTVAYPKKELALPDRFRGRPLANTAACGNCQACAVACPTEAILVNQGSFQVDLGRCLFCTDCARACPQKAITYDKEYRLAVNKREHLILRDGELLKRAESLNKKMKKIFGRSLRLRQVCAGGCGACEADINVLNTVVFDLGRFGIQFVASPRHADGMLVTGPVSAHMRLALQKTYGAIPDPKIIIASGSCAISGGPFLGHPEVGDGVDGIIPVDLYIPGCPPHPITVLDGLLRLLGRLDHSDLS
jgi:Ni,Fe-hydrogenase III small subunit/Pyruvate/2-oxoacid:ferredoxin oxidoreductase delta subunit